MTTNDLRAEVLRHLSYSLGKDPDHATLYDWRMALSLAVRDLMMDRWFTSPEIIIIHRWQIIVHKRIDMHQFDSGGRMICGGYRNIQQLGCCINNQRTNPLPISRDSIINGIT